MNSEFIIKVRAEIEEEIKKEIEEKRKKYIAFRVRDIMSLKNKIQRLEKEIEGVDSVEFDVVQQF